MDWNHQVGALADTIVAVSSPAGAAERGIVRLSGTAAWSICQDIFVNDEAGSALPGHGFQRCFGHVRLEQTVSVPGEMYLFRGPRSYTRQDCAELHLIGSPILLEWVVERTLELGARQATPGEFTARAFINGRIDLTQAEAVAAVIRAESDTQLRAARAMMDGDFAASLKDWHRRMAELCGLIEAEIDFAEEPITFVTPEQLRVDLKTLHSELDGLLARSSSMSRLEILPRILLLGLPNAGKSTLMNRLSGMERAICSPVAGTTRDILSAPIQLGHCEAILLDAAGVADDAQHELVAAAREQTLTQAARVEVLCLVIDGSEWRGGELPEWMAPSDDVQTVIALNKVDLMSADEVADACGLLVKRRWGPVCPVGATTGQGLDDLQDRLEDAITSPGGREEAGAVYLTARQELGIRSARDALCIAVEESLDLDETVNRAELLAFNLREALDSLASVSGAVTTEDLLHTVFSKFCIGK
ncbi:MAG: 50S ribosome-binding GTPase [Armatimonadetes bacterium]|nr:50S ribosome-binding GTPase [Armatimonadota bacterium]